MIGSISHSHTFRKTDGESAAFFRRTRHIQKPAILLHNAVHCRKAQTGPLANIFCCIKRFENTVDHFRQHLFTCIGHRKNKIANGVSLHGPGGDIIPRLSKLVCFNGDGSVAGNGIASIDKKAYHNLINLRRVIFHLAPFCSRKPLQLNILTNQPRQKMKRTVNGLIKI